MDDGGGLGAWLYRRLAVGPDVRAFGDFGFFDSMSIVCLVVLCNECG